MSTYTVVSKNFLYLRAIVIGSHYTAIARMKPHVTSAQLTDYCSAKRTQPSAQMRALEGHLALPIGWLERDNHALTQMSEDDFNLVQLLLKQPAVKKEAIHTLLADAVAAS